MKKIAFLALLAAAIFAGCTKDTPGSDPATPQDVTFTNSITGGGLKGLKAGNPTDCTNKAGTYAVVTIDGETFKPAVFTVNGSLYTQAIKLSPGSHTITTFTIWDDKGTPATTDDVIVRATPETGAQSTYTAFVTRPLPFNFMVTAFEKLEQNIEVLCFEDVNYQSFGFTWFKPVEVKVQQKWFFGDFCTENFVDYTGSLYGTGQVDMPAIFSIDIRRDGDGNGTYEEDFGTYENHLEIVPNSNPQRMYWPPLSVPYADRPNIADRYELRLYLYKKIGVDNLGHPIFGYVYQTSWYFSDANDILYTNPEQTQGSFDAGDDNVYDFIIGFCTDVPGDIIVPPVVPPSGQETAFARGVSPSVTATCFIETGLFSRWGWSNLMNAPTSGKQYDLPIYAGAGQCDVTKGTLVGNLHVVINSNQTANFTYQLSSLYKLVETHLYVGNAMFPLKHGAPTVAPGQYPYKHNGLGFTSVDTYANIPVPNPFYVIAHSVVSGF